MQRRILAGSLMRWGYEVLEADNGAAALDLCRSVPPDLILSDWMMPGMSGIEFCRAFRALQLDAYGYFILLTSKSDAHDVAQGFEAGADDFLVKPASPDDLQARISAATRILGMERELSAKNKVISETLQKLQDIHDRIDKDLLQAKTIQESLVPEQDRDFGRSRISLLLKPCGHIGGDLVGMFSPGRNRVAFYNIDVSGHGITSAMMTARLGSYLSSTHLEQNIAVEKRMDRFFALRPPIDVAMHLNGRLLADTGISEYFTMIYGTCDLRTGEVRMVQAGHPHPLLLHRDGSQTFLGEGGMPVGLFAEARFEQIAFRMEIGDRLLIHSDGFTEAILKDGSMLDQAGLQGLLRQVGDASGPELLDDLFWLLTEELNPETGIGDDVSALLFEYLGPEN
ncbi:MAG: fused response regulator/phosphatase [Rhodobacteraceae bacterium]|nr:MAG: fused response regulator/phosphatase [Paracoccaceae bacterium]